MFLTWYRFCTTASKTKMLNKPEMMKIRADRGRLKRGTILLSRSIRWALTSNKESTGCDVTPHSAGLLLIPRISSDARFRLSASGIIRSLARNCWSEEIHGVRGAGPKCNTYKTRAHGTGTAYHFHSADQFFRSSHSL